MRQSGKVLAVVMLVCALVSGACATGASESGNPGALLDGCHDQSQWAVGDSVTNEKNIGIAGWPNQGSQYGLWANLGIPGANAASLSTWLQGELATCQTKPSLIVFEGGINDLARGTSVADLEAIVAQLVSSVGVPIRVMTITPIARNSQVAQVEPQREEFNSWLTSTLHGTALDCNAQLADSDGWLQPALAADLLVHLTSAGEVTLANCIGNNI
jgi:hypothetical protein